MLLQLRPLLEHVADAVAVGLVTEAEVEAGAELMALQRTMHRVGALSRRQQERIIGVEAGAGPWLLL